MRYRPHTIVAFLAWIALTAGGSLAQSNPGRHGAAPESVTVTVMFKATGDDLFHCNPPDWGWDSLTWRLRPGQIIPHRFIVDEPEFRIGRAFAPDSAWFVFRHVLDAPDSVIHLFNAPDSFIVTSRWSSTYETIGIKDAGMSVRARLVASWPAPPPKARKTTSLRGRVIDDSTGCAVYMGRVVVDGTKLLAGTDTLGAFVVNGVPVGEIDVHGCALGYLSKHTVVRVPRDTLVFRLRRLPGVRFNHPCR